MYEALPQRLAILRRTKGMSQEELANSLGVSRQAVSKWERGESSPDTLNLIGLADLYEMSLDELVRGGALQEKESEASAEDTQANATLNLENASEETTQTGATCVTESTTDGVVKVEVVTTTIPLEAATSFMPKPPEQAPENNQGSDSKHNQGRSQNNNQGPTTAPNIPTAACAPDYPPPTDTAYELPVTPQPPAPKPYSQTPFTPTPATPQTPFPQAPAPSAPQKPFSPKPELKPAKPQGPLMQFPYPMLCVILYLVMGFAFQAWHPGWIIFFTVPIYYWIADIIEKDPIYQLRREQRRLQREAFARSQMEYNDRNFPPQ